MKFKSWLIHKLGGITKEECKIPQPNLILEEDKLIGVCAEMNILDNEYITEEQVENLLKEKLIKLIKPYMKVEKNVEFGTTKYSAIIKIPIKYTKEEESHGDTVTSSKV